MKFKVHCGIRNSDIKILSKDHIVSSCEILILMCYKDIDKDKRLQEIPKIL